MPIRRPRPCSNGPVDEETRCLAFIYSPEEAFWNKLSKCGMWVKRNVLSKATLLPRYSEAESHRL